MEGEILLPKRYVPKDCKPGDELRVFIYLDQEERLIATTQTPLAQVGEFACLEVAWVNQYGAFLNWGLMKDLFVPFREQKTRMEVGRKYIVHVHLDEESYRIAAYKVIIDNRYAGLLYESEIFQQLYMGMKVKAYIKQVREDGKIDLTLQKLGQAKVEDFSSTLLEYIRRNGGCTHLNDKSPADEIYALFGVSKKTFKKAVGDLYKKRLVTLQKDGIRLT